jgi:serine/threonine protein kinase
MIVNLLNSNNSSNRFNNNCINNNYNNNTAPPSKQIKIGNYLLGTTIGKGNSAVVKIATHVLTKQKVAIKIFDKSGLDVEKQLRLRREIESMKKLKHQNIVRLYEVAFFSLFFNLPSYY